MIGIQLQKYNTKVILSLCTYLLKYLCMECRERVGDSEEMKYEVRSANMDRLRMEKDDECTSKIWWISVFFIAKFQHCNDFFPRCNCSPSSPLSLPSSSFHIWLGLKLNIFNIINANFFFSVCHSVVHSLSTLSTNNSLFFFFFFRRVSQCAILSFNGEWMANALKGYNTLIV